MRQRLAEAGMSLKHQIKELTGRDVYVPEYEDIKKSDRVNFAGRALCGAKSTND